MISWIARIEDWILARIQRDCPHPDRMVAVDIMEGCGGDYEIGYCRRCGAVRIHYKNSLLQEWRLPDPHLWRNWKWLSVTVPAEVVTEKVTVERDT